MCVYVCVCVDERAARMAMKNISQKPFMHLSTEETKVKRMRVVISLSIRPERLPIAAALFFALPVGEMPI